jgi:hypothetical protein
MCLIALQAPESPGTDWAFMAAQERFAIEAAGVPASHRSLSQEQRSLLTSMAESDHRHREWASREMAKQGMAAFRACHVGQHLGDPEVKLRCRNVLRVLSRCEMCGGQGYKQESWGESECHLCRRAGYYLPVDPW